VQLLDQDLPADPDPFVRGGIVVEDGGGAGQFVQVAPPTCSSGPHDRFG
jgi:hypothetical protein